MMSSWSQMASLWLSLDIENQPIPATMSSMLWGPPLKPSGLATECTGHFGIAEQKSRGGKTGRASHRATSSPKFHTTIASPSQPSIDDNTPTSARRGRQDGSRCKYCSRCLTHEAIADFFYEPPSRHRDFGGHDVVAESWGVFDSVALRTANRCKKGFGRATTPPRSARRIPRLTFCSPPDP